MKPDDKFPLDSKFNPVSNEYLYSYRQIKMSFHWQERFHDHIIRDDEEYRRIAYYIVNNPASWRKGKFYSE